ncbi:Rieske (2Fe-2S) protein [Enhygromyxa salina]|uniref:3-phenylpropionate/cinnamic acid dioxygenase ferredoxin subunit n=1 Tax=Enhygromyxa salina TaxID=215803 RepID=A0A2S9YND5_9BACT|nr:Rieske 2Fe-2S domain-containing protein [Enhygromyxa salina]PRQ06598.1 3-phenylpropionate/cinnamic acid dioxygenase ferredoxin subunit [Enhygromyxa salina]
MSNWHEVTTVEELAQRRAMVFKRERYQLAIFHDGAQCHAVDNRCPHEGYPLSQGSVDDACVLTCNWHNWKFDLATGTNLYGGDDVRTYPVQVRDGAVWVDLSDPPIAELTAQILVGLRKAFDEQDDGWIARELARLVAAGLDPVAVAVPRAIEWCAPRLEWGTTHAFAATSDWIALYDRLGAEPGEGDAARTEARLVCASEAIDHLAFDALRQPEFVFAAPLAEGFDHDQLLEAIEREQEPRAVGLVRGGVAAGLGFAELERSFTHAALRHYAGFGHAMIYVVKTGELLQRLGPELADPLLSALTRYLVTSTREDLIPEFRSLADAIAAYPEHDGSTSHELGADWDAEVDALTGTSLKAMFRWIHEQARVRTPMQIWDALMRASARSMLCFDTRRSTATSVKVADNVGWLDFTHALTFGSAVRRQCSKYPELWGRGLLQMGCFVARNRAYLDTGIELEDWRVDDEDGFWAGVQDRLLDHGLPLPIFSAHLLKTSTAVALEADNVAAPTRALMLAALNRLLRSPIKQKHARRNVHQAMALIGL